MTEPAYYMLATRDDAGLITDDDLNEALDWFEDERGVPTEDFLDRLFPRYSGPTHPTTGAELDLDSLDNDAARRILARARKLKRERAI